MTSEQVNKIDLNNETNIEILRGLVKFWENEAYNAIAKLEEIKTITNQDMCENFNIDKIRDIIGKIN